MFNSILHCAAFGCVFQITFHKVMQIIVVQHLDMHLLSSSFKFFRPVQVEMISNLSIHNVSFVHDEKVILFYFSDPYYTPFLSSFWDTIYTICPHTVLLLMHFSYWSLQEAKNACCWYSRHIVNISVLSPPFLSTHCRSYAKPCYTYSYALFVTLYCYWLALWDFVPLLFCH